jgi:hypothetical protein
MSEGCSVLPYSKVKTKQELVEIIPNLIFILKTKFIKYVCISIDIISFDALF